MGEISKIVFEFGKAGIAAILGSERRLVSLFATPILGAALSLALFFVIRGWERKDLANGLANLAQERTEILHSKMLDSLEVLHSVAAFYAVAESISRHDFENFAGHACARHPELQGLSWNPLVSDARRSEFEEAARRDGFADFTFSEMSARGQLVPAAKRGGYVPVYFEQPFKNNEAALGFDLASNPQRKAALEQARDSGLPAATMPLRLVQEMENQKGFLVLAPVFDGAHETIDQRRKNLAGFVSAIFRIGDLVETAWRNLTPGLADVLIVDRSNGSALIYQSPDYRDPKADQRAPESRQTLSLAGVTWDVVFRATSRYQAMHSVWQSWAALAAGLLIASLGTAYIFRGMRRTAEIEKRVAERTKELSSEVAERLRAEGALRQAEEKYRGIFENSIEGIFQTTPDGRYLSANSALARIYGYSSPAELMAVLDDIGGKLYVKPERRIEFMRLVQGRGAVSDFESQIWRKDRTIIWISEKARAVRNEDGGLLYYEGAVEDISNRKKAEETLEKAHRELELRVAARTEELAKSNSALQAEIVERKRAEDAADSASRAKSTFLAHMSHEIRTPLNAILGYAQILQRNQNLAPDQRRAIETIASSGNHLFGLIDDVLDISKIEAGRMELQSVDFDLTNFARRLASMFQHRCEQKGIRMRIDHRAVEPCWVHGDEGKLRQVLINLLGNAVKFTEAGEVSFKIEAREAGVFRFEIQDTGIGIPMEEQADILQPFQQGAGGIRQGSTGLGLAISKHYIELMGGELQFTSQSGKGSRFYFSTPLPTTSGICFSPKQHSLRLASQYGVRALVVDDVAENREVLSAMLEAMGCKVSSAENGAMAIEMARNERPDIIFMDIWMAGMNGIEATQRILAEHGNRIKLVAHSASAFDHEQRRYLDAGFDDFFAKPLRWERVGECLKNTLGIEFEPPESRLEAGPSGSYRDFVPPEPFAGRLKSAAELYSVTEIKSCLAEIARLGAEGRVFAAEAQRLADAYDMEAILQRLEAGAEATFAAK